MFKKQYWYAIGIYLLMQILSAVIPLIIYKVTGSVSLETSVYVNIALFMMALATILWLMWGDMREEKLAHPMSAGRLIGWVALGLLMAWIAEALAASILVNVLGISDSSANTESIVEISRLNPIFIFIPAMVGPILEEVIFRKIIFGYLNEKFNFIIAAVVSALIFGVAHMELQLLLLYFAIGFVFAYLYMKTKRIIVPILVHMSLNTVAVIGQLLIGPEQLQRMQDELMIIFMFH